MNSSDRLEKLGMQVPDILLPANSVDLEKWAVVACDQYTSEPGYWRDVEDYIGDSPSTLHLVYPEVYLQRNDKEQRISAINDAMRDYQKAGLLREVEKSFVYVQRTLHSGGTRSGLMAALDLDRYSYEKGSGSLIRATEGTILDRLPPRIQIRKNAPIEIPHIMVLIDDKENLLFQALAEAQTDMEQLYATPLMKQGGSVSGYRVQGEIILDRIAGIFEQLYGDAVKTSKQAPLLFAMGDGNHSFATAKSIWKEVKRNGAPLDHPARYALVEIVNIYDPGLLFEPIHRLLMGAGIDAVAACAEKTPGVTLEKTKGFEEALAGVTGDGNTQVIAVTSKDCTGVLRFTGPASDLAVATLDAFIDGCLKQTAGEIDYIHGAETTKELSGIPSEARVGFILPDFTKDQLFPTVIKDGALPRKTFSMGEAQEKRYYMEARKIIP